jgi:hypothetical protein
VCWELEVSSRGFTVNFYPAGCPCVFWCVSAPKRRRGLCCFGHRDWCGSCVCRKVYRGLLVCVGSSKSHPGVLPRRMPVCVLVCVFPKRRRGNRVFVFCWLSRSVWFVVFFLCSQVLWVRWTAQVVFSLGMGPMFVGRRPKNGMFGFSWSWRMALFFGYLCS